MELAIVILVLIVAVLLFLLNSSHNELEEKKTACGIHFMNQKIAEKARDLFRRERDELKAREEIMVQMAVMYKAKYVALSDTGAIWSNLSQLQREQYTEAARLRILEGTIGQHADRASCARS